MFSTAHILLDILRVVIPATMERRIGAPAKVVGGVRLEGFNSHSNSSTESYVNVAAALGQTPAEVDLFLTRLDKALAAFRRQWDHNRLEPSDPLSNPP